MAAIITTIEEFVKEINKITAEKYSGCDEVKSKFIKPISPKRDEYNLIFNIENQEIKMVFWYGGGGVTHSIAQKNSAAIQQILKPIIEEVEKRLKREDKQNQHTFGDIKDNFVNELKADFENEPYRIENTHQANIFKIFFNNVFNVTISYFESTSNLFVQGKNSPLWDEVFYLISEKSGISSEETVQFYINSSKDLSKLNIVVPKEFQDEKLEDVLSKDLYNNSSILLPSDKKLLKTTLINLSLNIELPDYSFMLVPSFRVVEGLLKRLISKYNLTNLEKEKTNPNSFYQFHTAGNKLNGQYCDKLNDDRIIIEVLENLYLIYCSYRKEYCHSVGVNPKIIENKNEALAIFNMICTLLKKIQENTDRIFNEETVKV